MSQSDFPKQFLSIFNERPLIVQTLDRIKSYFRKDERVLIIPKELRNLTRKYIGKELFIIEPMRRNTAPAICLAAMTLKKYHGDGIMHVMPADHLISTRTKYIAALKLGQEFAQKDYLVTYGIEPNRPEIGYGYIKIGRKIGLRSRVKAFKGQGFTEKPSFARAKKYIKSKKYLWNSGIFSFRIGNILEEIKNFIPEVYQGVANYLRTGKKIVFQRIPDISIDYGVMEKCNKLCIVKGNFLWDDVGSWLSLERYFKKDRYGNIKVGDIKGLEINGTIMYTYDIPLRVYGVKDLIVVVSSRWVLVCRKNRAQDVKKLFR
jgi:mannose-1-phosphate guanylyltransferase